MDAEKLQTVRFHGKLRLFLSDLQELLNERNSLRSINKLLQETRSCSVHCECCIFNAKTNTHESEIERGVESVVNGGMQKENTKRLELELSSTNELLKEKELEIAKQLQENISLQQMLCEANEEIAIAKRQQKSNLLLLSALEQSVDVVSSFLFQLRERCVCAEQNLQEVIANQNQINSVIKIQTEQLERIEEVMISQSRSLSKARTRCITLEEDVAKAVITHDCKINENHDNESLKIAIHEVEKYMICVSEKLSNYCQKQNIGHFTAELDDQKFTLSNLQEQ